ncbi:unnamed protein product [Calypogeia fissa]
MTERGDSGRDGRWRKGGGFLWWDEDKRWTMAKVSSGQSGMRAMAVIQDGRCLWREAIRRWVEMEKGDGGERKWCVFLWEMTGSLLWSVGKGLAVVI